MADEDEEKAEEAQGTPPSPPPEDSQTPESSKPPSRLPSDIPPSAKTSAQPVESTTPAKSISATSEVKESRTSETHSEIASKVSSKRLETSVSNEAEPQPLSLEVPVKSVSTTGEAKSSVVLRTSQTASGGNLKRSGDNSVDKSAPQLEQEKSKTKVGVLKSMTKIPASMSGVSATFPVFLSKRSPYTHNPPQPEERRPRIESPRTPREYIINLRENLADFQESHGLPRTRDYSFVSLGLALAQETLRALYSVFLMFAELFPILEIVSLILRFALDKLIEILETPDPTSRAKKIVIFFLEMIIILIPLWILIGTIVLPLVSLMFSIFKRMLHLKGGKKRSSVKSRPKPKPRAPGVSKVELCD